MCKVSSSFFKLKIKKIKNAKALVGRALPIVFSFCRTNDFIVLTSIQRKKGSIFSVLDEQEKYALPESRNRLPLKLFLMLEVNQSISVKYRKNT
jgi:hypothetical protein